MSDSVGRAGGPAFNAFTTVPPPDLQPVKTTVPGGTIDANVSIQDAYRQPSPGSVASERIALVRTSQPTPETTARTIVTLGSLGNSAAVNIEAISRVLNDNARESRKAMKLDRAEARDANMQALQQAADDVRSGAEFTLVATEVSASFSMAGAVAGGVGAAKSAGAGEDSPTEMETTEETEVTSSITNKPATVETETPSATSQAANETGPQGEIEEKLTTPKSRMGYHEDDNEQVSEAVAQAQDNAAARPSLRTGFHESDESDGAKGVKQSQGKSPTSTVEPEETPTSTDKVETSGEKAARNAQQANSDKIAEKVRQASRETPEKLTKSAAADLKAAENEADPVKADDYRTQAKIKLAQADELRQAQATRISRMQNQQQITNSVSQVIENAGKLLAGPATLEASMYDAKKMDDQALATKEQARADDDSDFIKSYGDLASSVLDKLSSMLDAQAQANNAIASNARG